MSTRILIIGNNRKHLETSKRKLSEGGFAVAICSDGQDVTARIDKLKPDVVFIHTSDVSDASTGLYNNLVDNVRYATLPVIFTLSENDVYLVNRRRAATPEKWSVLASDPIEAVYTALQQTATQQRSELSFRDIRMLYRA